MVNNVIAFLSFLTLFSNILFVVFFLLFLSRKFIKKTPWGKIEKFLTKHSLALAFFFALVATLGSLFLSEVAKFTPCKFCWYQRILMYPLVLVLGTALIKKTKDVVHYVLPLSVFGTLMALYHYYSQVTYNPYTSCGSIGFSISCSDRFFTHYGYITIPFMSLSAFVYITSLMLMKKRGDKK